MQRKCGDCQLCCKLLPTKEVGSLAGERCKYQKHGVGCRIYARRPHACALWNCVWLGGEFRGPRPDRAHYVIDILPDYVTMTYANEPPRHVPVIQVWIDPAFPDAHRDPALRAYLAKQGEERGEAAIIRYSDRDGFVLFPPAMASDHQWHEERGTMENRKHNLRDVADKLGGEIVLKLAP